MSNNVFIIAEAGINHNGEIKLARKMIDVAHSAGADCIKFQTFKAEEFVSDPKQTYTYKSQGREITESMLEMFKRYQFSGKDWQEIIAYCRKVGIQFSSTAQNRSDLEFLLSITDLPFLKVGSDDLTNLVLIKDYASRGIPMIISSGMAYAYEIEDAIRTARECGNDDVTVLHCVSSYPADHDQVNLKKIPVIRDAFNVPVGFSDHTIGSAAAVGAVCFGATVIEKHFTLDKNFPGPDHWFSIDGDELKSYVENIRFIEQAIGSDMLGPTEKEMEMRRICRRKIVADQNLERGETVTIDKISFKRSEAESAIEPKNIEYILGRRVKNNIEKNKAIDLNSLE